MDWSILDCLDDADRDRVLGSAVRRTFRRRAHIVRQGESGDSLHFLERGRAAVQVSTPNGDVVSTAVIGPGTIFGEQALIGEATVRAAAVVALEPVTTLALRRSEFERLRGEHPTIDAVLVQALSQRVNRLTDQLVEALFVSAETRILRRLSELASAGSGTGPSGGACVELTQEELAELAGTSRPTVNRVLAELARDGVVSVRRGAVDIDDPTELARLAGP